MARHKVNLDQRIHRTILVDKNLSTDPRFDVFPRSDAAGNHLEIINKTTGVTKKVKCNFIFTPPRVGTKIRSRQSGSQHECDLDDAIQRTLELGNELSSTPGISLIFVNRKDPSSPTQADFLMMSEPAGDETIETGETKIPPNTGTEFFKKKKTPATSKKPAKKKAAKKKVVKKKVAKKKKK